MENITTNAINVSSVVTETTKQYNEKGFAGAVAYLSLIAMIVIAIGVIWYIRKTYTNSEKLQNDLLDMFKENINKKIDDNNKLMTDMLDEIKNITNIIKDGMFNMVETCNKNNDKMLGTINSEKEVGLNQFEKESKRIIEIYLLRLKESLQDRIEKNSLFQSQNKILGNLDKAWKDGELYEEIKRNHILSKEEIEDIGFKDDRLKLLLFEKYDIIIMNELILDICKSFTVTTEKYNKSDIYRDVKKSISSALNKIAEIDLTK